ncbi:aminoacyl-tRNA hydrolase [Candidatus Microgenomates bacterium]|nr:aminoacyl-tRNA hydrolase [Candidatus Microgenomates bacterium]
MKLIIGLGNPGEKYANTRHNIGFMAVDRLLKDLAPIDKSVWQKDKKNKSEIAKVGGVILAKPQTFMNESGWAVKRLVDFFHIGPDDVWVIHDDLDLSPGKIKIRKGGGTAGHHGLESIAESLKTLEFIRFRLGIGRPQGHGEWEKTNVKRREIERYVLSEFGSKEEKEVKTMIKKVGEAIRLSLEKGIEEAMNRYN